MKRVSMMKQPLLGIVNDHVADYPSPSNLNYFWSFGSIAGICLVVQIATGIFLAIHYTPHVDLAFASVEHIMRDVEGGWFLRYMHANGAIYIIFYPLLLLVQVWYTLRLFTNMDLIIHWEPIVKWIRSSG
eukprot:jgi/Picsp_1/4502/NSC_06723-R1_apocytochrome b